MKTFGVWNKVQKQFQFGINEPTKALARKKLKEKIGFDALKYRFEVKEMKAGYLKFISKKEKVDEVK